MGTQGNFPSRVSLLDFLLAILLAVPAVNARAGTAFNSRPKPPITDWRSLESGDYQTYVQNLQAIGCPPQTIRVIVTADVISAFAGKRAEDLAARYQDFPYWKSDPSEMKAEAAVAAQRQAIDAKMSGVLQFLLGADTDLPDFSQLWKRETLDYELAFLTSAKRQATEAILLDCAKVNRQMGELADGDDLTQDTNALQRILQVYQDEQSALRALLAPDEYEQVEMTTSWTANNLRHAMVHFEPTAEEFRVIFDAWQRNDDHLARIHALRLPDPGHLEDAVYAKIKTQLSAARYQQYRDTWWK